MNQNDAFLSCSRSDDPETFILSRAEPEKHRPLRIGFAGAHRTGKSVLAKSVAEELGIYFHATHVSDAPVWKEIHSSPSDQFTFAERIEIQHRLLEYLEKQYATRAEKAFIADRTPLDVVGYLFSAVDNTCSDLWTNSTRALVSKAISLSIKYFDKIFLVQPKILAVVDSGKCGKVYLSEVYRTAINNNILAFGVNYLDSDRFKIIPTSIAKLEDRVAYVLARS